MRQIAASPDFIAGAIGTAYLSSFEYTRNAADVIAPGTQTTVQDYPGRIGYWRVGVPPSGPMDSLSFRVANRLVGNAEGAPALEIAVTGPALRFRAPAVIALTGADFQARLDGAPLPVWRAVSVPAGATLELDRAAGAGARAYLAIGGGFDSPDYLGSASTFILGKFGGPFGRVLRTGDVLAFGRGAKGAPRALAASLSASRSVRRKTHRPLLPSWSACCVSSRVRQNAATAPPSGRGRQQAGGSK